VRERTLKPGRRPIEPTGMRVARQLAAGLALALLGNAGSAPGEVYRWVDEKGELHFTGDLDQVPPRYRHRATAPVSGPNSTLNLTPQETDPAQEAAREERLEALRRLNARPQGSPSPRRPAGPAKPAKATAAPRKYERDCDHRTANGRCHSKLNPEWVRWNQERRARAPTGEEP
jgi:hypothetical protein